ncbi:3 beta-hydroxysteroid dehydrogenase type 7 [Tachysurus ichikawai]
MNTENPELVYLLTGGCGFLGQHLLKVLLEKEEKVKEIRLFDKHIDSSLEDCSTGKEGRRGGGCSPRNSFLGQS